MAQQQYSGTAFGGLSRRQFLLRSGLIVAGAGGGSSLLAACAGGGGGTGTGGGGGGGGGGGAKSIRILLWSHFVPKYDDWFDPWAKAWGEQNNVTVTVDHIDQADLPTRTAAEFGAGSGHDLIEWITPPSAYEPSVHDMKDVVQEATSKYGDQISFCKASSYNPKTGKYYGFCHTYTPDPGDYRKSLWSAVGMGSGPTTWEELLTGGAKIKQQKKVRMGIGMSSEVDSNMAARALIWSFDGAIQDENENVTLNSPQTVQAVKYMAELYKKAMSPEVFSWTAASNNQGLIAGELSFILNSISAYRSAQTTNVKVSDDIFFLPALKGPGGTGLASQHVVRDYIMPKWAKNTDQCKQFLLDLVAAGKESVKNSELYDFPAFANTPGSAPLPGWLSNDPFGSHPADKLEVLGTAQKWTTNVGHPGPASPAIGEIFDTNVISTMMANVARGKSTAEDAVSKAHGQCESIFKKWRAKGLVGGSS
ncbi:MAG TPA: extracellular solute-binding protein [Nocardioidaceae bacterium]|nr:extracellular solute-binding protein [Nocardioidaceae bacterium]